MKHSLLLTVIVLAAMLFTCIIGMAYIVCFTASTFGGYLPFVCFVGFPLITLALGYLVGDL